MMLHSCSYEHVYAHTGIDSHVIMKTFLCFLGDHLYKRNESKPAREQVLSALPDIAMVTLEQSDEFLVIACEGIWYELECVTCPY